MYSITKVFRFESAHRLSKGYEGKCQNIHGHNYICEITIRGDKLDEFGFIKDFSNFKEIKLFLDDLFDHKLILHEDDPFIIEFERTNCDYRFGGKAYFNEKENEQEFGYVLMEDNPTVEVMSKFIYDEIKKWYDVRVYKIKLYENENSWCEYTEGNDRKRK